MLFTVNTNFQETNQKANDQMKVNSVSNQKSFNRQQESIAIENLPLDAIWNYVYDKKVEFPKLFAEQLSCSIICVIFPFVGLEN